MSEYVPTTDEVQAMWSDQHAPAYAEADREFDRWLNQVRADARREGQAEAWREGRNAGVDDMIAADLGVNRRNLPNPYEAEEDRHVDQ